MDEKKLVKELTLALIYLTSFKENEFGFETEKSWSGYPFLILDELAEDDLITKSKKAKSLYMTIEGKEKAQILVEKLSKSLYEE